MVWEQVEDSLITKTKNAHPKMNVSFNQQLSILPGRRQPSTFDVYELNYCVRYGNRWNLAAIATECLGEYLHKSIFPENFTEERLRIRFY